MRKSIGTVSAILFYILSLQTGLTTLQPDKRFIRLCRNLCLLLTALLHFLHNMVSPILMSLSAAHNPSRKRHARALLVCLFLLTAPVALLTSLWTQHKPSTWLLAVTVFSIEVVVKVSINLTWNWRKAFIISSLRCLCHSQHTRCFCLTLSDKPFGRNLTIIFITSRHSAIVWNFALAFSSSLMAHGY